MDSSILASIHGSMDDMSAMAICGYVVVRGVVKCPTLIIIDTYQWRRHRQGEGGKLPPYGWTSENSVICVCFHCHGTSSYHDKYITRPSSKEPR